MRTSRRVACAWAILAICAFGAMAQPKPASKAKPDPNGYLQPPKATAAAAVAQPHACLNLHNGPSVSWFIDVTFDPNTYPFKITGGTIKGTICDPGKYQITSGSMGNALQITAKYTGSSSCGAIVDIKGNFQNPPSYKGTYLGGLPQTSLFLGYMACP
jgi:hypothetical protein